MEYMIRLSFDNGGTHELHYVHKDEAEAWYREYRDNPSDIQRAVQLFSVDGCGKLKLINWYIDRG